jgi:hypothetical protein
MCERESWDLTKCPEYVVSGFSRTVVVFRGCLTAANAEAGSVCAAAGTYGARTRPLAVNVHFQDSFEENTITFETIDETGPVAKPRVIEVEDVNVMAVM